jgi:hypothetical protein
MQSSTCEIRWVPVFENPLNGSWHSEDFKLLRSVFFEGRKFIPGEVVL